MTEDWKNTRRMVMSAIEYDAETGLFRWKERSGSGGSRPKVWFKPEAKGDGRAWIQINKRRFLVHRLAWLIVNGEWPDGELKSHVYGSTKISDMFVMKRICLPRRSFGRDAVSEHLGYDPETGMFIWKTQLGPSCREGWFIPADFGKGAGSIDIFGCRYICTHLAWLLHHGVWPDFEIDHINGDSQDHRIDNLRDVKHAVNMKNIKTKKSNKTGVNGVSVSSKSGRFCAYISVNGESKNLGHFKTIEEAALARKAAEKEYGFHENHGRKVADGT